MRPTAVSYRLPAIKKGTYALSQIPDDSLAQVRVIWQAAGRPEQAKFRAAANREGFNLSVKEAANFVRSQPDVQAFAPAPCNEGKATSPELNDKWQCDLVDYEATSPERNDGNRLELTCIDVFGGFAHVGIRRAGGGRRGIPANPARRSREASHPGQKPHQRGPQGGQL